MSFIVKIFIVIFVYMVYYILYYIAENKMEKRENYLLQLKSYTEGIDKELTMILQSLQWDRNHFKEGTAMAICKYEQSHRIPSDKKEEHEKTCFYKQQGYSSTDTMLPDPSDIKSNTLVKLNNEDISRILDAASKLDPSFKKVSIIFMAMNTYILFIGSGSGGPEPASLARLQAVYSADERRAIHDAVVSAAPSCHDLADLALLSSNGEEQKGRSKSRVEILAELRDMRRRRAKYRGAAKTRNYSDVLRDLIKTQMEFYTDVHSDASIATTPKKNIEINKHADNSKHNEHSNVIQMHKTDYQKHDRHKDSRDTFKDKGSRRSSERRIEGTNERDRYVERSRDKRYDGREEFTTRKYEGKYNFTVSSKCKDEGSSHSDRDKHKHRSRDRRYDNSSEYIKTDVKESYSRSSKHEDDGRSHRTYREKERSKEGKYEIRESVPREEGIKYDQFKYRDSKRRYEVEERSSRSYRQIGIDGDQSQRDEKYRRYYDAIDQNNHDKRKKSKK